MEIIVVDGGSRDRTRVLARESGARVILHEAAIENGGGRGGQIHAGIHAAAGDVLAVVHADTTVCSPVFTRMVNILAAQPFMAGGAAGCVFEGDRPGLRIIEAANDFRMACLGISFGDQIQFFRRRPVVETDLFPNIPLMEDVELSLRLHRSGRQVFLFENALVSSRKWEKRGIFRAIQVICLVSTYLVGRLFKSLDTVALYRRYYR